MRRGQRTAAGPPEAGARSASPTASAAEGAFSSRRLSEDHGGSGPGKAAGRVRRPPGRKQRTVLLEARGSGRAGRASLGPTAHTSEKRTIAFEQSDHGMAGVGEWVLALRRACVCVPVCVGGGRRSWNCGPFLSPGAHLR